MKALLVAVQFLTRLPTPRLVTTERDFAHSIRLFPIPGLIIGLVVAGATQIGGRIDSWVAALAGLLLWVGVTGALHLDGLADLADVSGALHRDPARLREVMADPHVGSFGVVAIAMQLLTKLVLLHALATRGIVLPVILVPFAARIGPLAWSRWLPPLHPGLAARFSGVVRARDLAGWGLVLLGACVAVPFLIATPMLIGGWGLWLKRKLGGVSGDCHGAGIELVETGLLAALVVAGGL